jgi:ABC-type transport system substrate-binding protein
LLVSAAFAGSSRESRRGGTLSLMWGVDPDYVDPALAVGLRGSWMLLNATCAKLFNFLHDPETGRARNAPEVVASYTVSDSGRMYTFELKRTFRFHTGEQVTAQSFADAFNRNAIPRLNSFARRRHLMDEIVGADAAMQGKAATISGVQVLGRYRLRILLTRRAGDFVARLTMPSFCPILPGMPTDPAGVDRPPASGPYHIAERILNRRIVLVRNPNYGGVRDANPDRIVWTIDPDPRDRLSATEQNQNDFTPVFGYPDAVVRDLADRYGVNRRGGRLLRLPAALTTWVFAFNPRRGPLAGRAQAPLRKAINYAIDRRALAGAHPYLTVRRTDRLLPASLTESRRLYPIDGADPVTARKWFARAGHRPRTLVLYTANDFPFSVMSANVFRDNLRQLGIEVTVRYFSLVTLYEKLNTPGEPWDVTWLPWGAWYPDPAGATLPLLRGTRYEARLNAANRVTGAARAKTWADLEADLMRNDPPVAAYADATALILISRNLGCLRTHPQVDLDLAAVCKLDGR